MAFPRFVFLSASNGEACLRSVPDEEPAFVWMDGEGSDVGILVTKFEIEPSEHREEFVHIKCCNTCIDGRVVTTRKNDGIYPGVNYYDFQYDAVPEQKESNLLPVTMKNFSSRPSVK